MFELEEYVFSKFLENLQYSANDSKLLGLRWEKGSDNLIFDFEDLTKNFTNVLTKRSLIHCIASIFDPLGLIIPVIINYIKMHANKSLNRTIFFLKNFKNDGNVFYYYHSHKKRNSLDTRAVFIEFLKYVENSGVVVYQGDRSFKIASKSEELLAGDDIEEILAVKDSDILAEPNDLDT